MSILEWIYGSGIDLGQYRISTMELIGVLFGLASAVGGMLRRVWAWPIGIVGNVILFFVYIWATIQFDDRAPLFGQSGRQVFFIATSLYGWWRWQQVRSTRGVQDEHAITPRWASWRERVLLIAGWLAAVVVVQAIFRRLGAGWPAPDWYFWCDAWIFVGSFIATFAMARGLNEFWLAWIAVDIVGVPLLLHSNYVPTAVMYAFYAAFVIYGFVVWMRATRAERPDLEPATGRGGSATTLTP